MKKTTVLFAFIISFLLSFKAFSQLPTYVPTTGLVAYYTFDGNASDVSGNGNNGTNYGGIASTDRFNNPSGAYYFSGLNCDTRVEANINTTSITTAITVSYWVQQTGAGCISPRVIEFYANDGPGQIQNSFNGFSHWLSNSQVVTIPLNVVPDSVWTHIVYTNDGTTAKVIQDGILINTTNVSGNPVLSGNVAFGRMNHPAWDAHEGKLDDIGIWNRVLTDCEIEALFLSSSPNYIPVQPIDVYVPVNSMTSFSISVNPCISSVTMVWQEDQGSGFVSLNNVGVYSGVNTANLNISTADITMDGWAYRCIVFDSMAPIDTSDIAFLYIATTPVGNLGVSQAIGVSPNPSNGHISITTPFDLETVEVYDFTGRLVKKGKSPKIFLDGPSGLYMVRVNGIYFEKVLKK